MLTAFDLFGFRDNEVLSMIRNIEDAADLSQLNFMRQESGKGLEGSHTWWGHDISDVQDCERIQ